MMFVSDAEVRRQVSFEVVLDASGLAIQDLAAAQAALLCIRGTNR